MSELTLQPNDKNKKTNNFLDLVSCPGDYRSVKLKSVFFFSSLLQMHFLTTNLFPMGSWYISITGDSD